MSLTVFYPPAFRIKIYLVLAGYLQSGLSEIDAVVALRAAKMSSVLLEKFCAQFLEDKTEKTLGERLLSLFQTTPEEAALLACVCRDNQASPDILRDLVLLLSGKQAMGQAS